MQSEVIIKNSSLFLESSFQEKVDEKTGKKEYLLTAFIVPFNKVSRNGVMYSKESIENTHQDLVGKPVMFNHIINTIDAISRGEWIETWLTKEGMWASAKIYDTSYNQHLLEYLKAASNPAVSLQVKGGAEQKKGEDGKYYREAKITEWLECSVIGGVQGFKDATVKNFEVALAEAFNSLETFDESITPGEYTTKGDEKITVHSVSDGKAVISGDDSKKKQIDLDALKNIVKDDKVEDAKESFDFFEELVTARDNVNKEAFSQTFPVSGFIKGLDEEGREHPNFKPCDVARIVIDHLEKDMSYYDEDSEHPMESFYDELSKARSNPK